MTIPLADIQERIAFVLANQTEWQAIVAVHECIAAVESLAQQDALESARQRLRESELCHMEQCARKNSN